MDWIEVVGKALVFASFWFLAPEIAGEQRLKSISKGTLSTIAALLGFVVWVVVLAVLSGVLPRYLPTSLNPFAQAPIEKGFAAPEARWLVEVRRFMAFIILAVAMATARLTRAWLDERVVRPWVTHLSESESMRAMWVRIGLWLFVLGSMIDMGWWLWDKKISKWLGIG